MQGLGWTLVFAMMAFMVLHAMPFGRVVLWSPMRGRVLLNGQPAAGAVLVRRYHWHCQNGGRPIAVTCRLDSEPRDHGEVFGRCEFERFGLDQSPT